MRWEPIHPSLVRYGGAILAVVAATLGTRFLTTLGDAGISPLFFAAILLSAWFGGLGPGLVATAFSGVSTAYLLMPQVNSFAGVRDAVLRLGVFTIVALLSSSLHAATRRAAEASRKAKEAAEEASAAKTRFLAMVSHELRTPLSSVVMIADAMAQDSTLPRQVRDDAASVLRSVDLEVRLIDDLVDLSRIGSGKLRLDKQPLDVHEPLQAALQLCNADLNEKQIELATDLGAENRTIVGDAVRLQQIFWNLIRNAVKFTPDAGQIKVATRNDRDGKVVIEFTDNGIGIDPAQLSSIFEAFEQGSPDITARFGGLGLGLAICQALTEAHGGAVTAASAGLNLGSTFSVSLPLSHETAGFAIHVTGTL